MRASPFVGRADGLSFLEEQLEIARSGRLRVAVLLGEAGMGKTRLAVELVGRHRSDVLALSARAYPLGATASLGLWVEALEGHLRGCSADEVRRLCGAGADDLTTLLPSVGAVARPKEHDPARIRMLEALVGLLERLAAQRPLVVVLDDVHLADGSSWEALNYLARNLVGAPILLVLIARPGELAQHRIAGEVVRGLEQEDLLTRVAVGPLTQGEIEQLAAGFVEGAVPPALSEWLDSRSQGSPLLVIGLLRALLEEGADLERPSLHTLPESLVERVGTRLVALDPAARTTLDALAVTGRRTELGDLARLTGHSIDELAPILDRLEQARFVAEVELEAERGLWYEISHPLIQDAIYQQLTGARRRVLHRAVASLLVESEQFGAAASHVVRSDARDDQWAVDTLCEALRRAEGQEHHREALALLDALTELLPEGDGRWLDVVEVMPVTPEWVIDHRADTGADVGVRALRRIEHVLEDSGDPRERAAVRFNMGSLLTWGMSELAEGRALVASARTLFDEQGDEASALLASNELGYYAGMSDDGAEHERVARGVLAAAQALEDVSVQLQAQCSLAWALMLSGRLTDALTVVDDGMRLAASAGKSYRHCYLLAMGAFVRHLLGWRGVDDDLDAAKLRYAAFRDTLLLDFEAHIAWQSGDLVQVVADVRDQRAWDGGGGLRRLLGSSMGIQALAELGRSEEAAQLESAAAAVLRGGVRWTFGPMLDWSSGVALGLRGDSWLALDRLRAALRDALDRGYWTWGRWVAADVAELGVTLGDRQAVDAAAGALASDPWPQPGTPHDGLRAFVQGAAAIAAGRRDDAGVALEAAADAFASAGWTLFEGRARALWATSHAGSDRRRALEVAEAAADRFTRCGASVRLDRVAKQAGNLGGRARARVTLGPEALSPREREVARLAVEGLTARQIAAELIIGERTVETHLAHAYDKLGVGSKVELARRAAEFGL